MYSFGIAWKSWESQALLFGYCIIGSLNLSFQGFIRASVTQEHNATQIKPTTPFLEIKLPVPTEASKEKQLPLSATTKQSPVSDHQREEEEEEEEDWDAFQSFPATTNAAENDSRDESSLETPNLVEKSSLLEVDTVSDQFHGDSISQLPNNVEATSKADHQEAGGAEVISGSLDDLTSSQGNVPCENVETEEPHEFQTNSDVIEACHDRKERDDEVVSRPEDGMGAGLNRVMEQIPSELHPVKEDQGLVGMNSGHHEPEENTDNRPVQVSSDPLQLDEEVKGAGSNQVTEHIPSDLHPVEDAQGSVAVNSADHEQKKENPDNKRVQEVSSDPLQLDDQVKEKREDKEEPAVEDSRLQPHGENSKDPRFSEKQ